MGFYYSGKRETIMVKRLKKAIRIQKGNPYHDELGKFTTAEGAKAYPKQNDAYEERLKEKVDGAKKLICFRGVSEKTIRNEIIESDNRKFAKIRSEALERFEILKSADDRIEIDENKFEKNFNMMYDYFMSGDRSDPAFLEASLDNATKVAVSSAMSEYAKKSGIRSVIWGEDLNISATLDYIDGVAWAKENIGFDRDINVLSGCELSKKVMASTRTSESLEVSMKISTDHFGNDRIIDSESNNGFNIKNQSAKSVGVHEAAHVIEGDIALKAKSYTDDAYSALQQDAVSKEIMARANKAVGGDAENNTKAVSQYATANSSEAFAECLADCYANGEDAQELSKAVLKVVKEEREDIIKTIGDKTSWLE